MKIAKILCLAALLCSGVTLRTSASDTPPERLTYQSFVVDANGQALGLAGPKNYDIIFRIWSDAGSTDASKLLWAEQQTVTIDKGYFSVLLGEGTEVPGINHGNLSTLFAAPDASERYVELTVKNIGAGNQDATIAPRLRLLTAPYAFLARHAVTANGLFNQTNGSVVTVTGRNVGINTANPTAPLEVVGKVKASSFEGGGITPIGGIIMWSGALNNIPAGWALCDGKNGTPNLSGRFVLGAGNGVNLTPRSVGQFGGAETHTLTAAEIPPHAHPLQVKTVGYSSGWNDSNEAVGAPSQSKNNGNQTMNTANAGGGAPHNNMPPYYVLAYLMRVQ